MKRLRTFSGLQRKDHQTMTSGWQGTPSIQEVRPGAGFKTGDFVKRNVGGATAERLDTGKQALELSPTIPTCLPAYPTAAAILVPLQYRIPQ